MAAKKVKVIEFIEGVTFKFHGNFEKVSVEKLEHIPDDDLPDGSDEFDPNRSVFNFRLYNEGDQTTVTKFDGIIELTVEFLSDDLASATSIEALDLGYHQGTKWVSCFKKHGLAKGFHKKDKKKKVKKPWVGYGTMKIKDEWADPVMAWGP
jgi:hypothetical protein